MAEQMYARLHPYEPRRGYKVKIFVVFGQKFEAAKGWYSVSPALAEKLRKCKQDAYNPESKLVFQIANQKDAKGLAMEQYAKANPAIQIERAIEGAQSIDEEALNIPPEDDYEGMRKSDLFAKATDRDLEVSSSMTKAEIVETLRVADAKNASASDEEEEEIPFS